MHEGRLRVPCPSPDAAAAVSAALGPELDEGPEGATVALQQDGGILEFHLQAPDVATLRAGLNSILRLLDAAQASVQAAAGGTDAGPRPP